MDIKKKIGQHPYRFLSTTSDRLNVRFEKDKLKEVLTTQDEGYRLEVIKDKKVGSSASNMFDTDSLVTKALASADFGDVVDYNYPQPQPLSKVELYSQSVVNITPEYLIKTGK